MKHLIIILFIAFSIALFAEDTKQVPLNSTEYVYICTGPKSVRYHNKKDCRGLNRCSGKIEKISKADAVKKGRTACKICYK